MSTSRSPPGDGFVISPPSGGLTVSPPCDGFTSSAAPVFVDTVSPPGYGHVVSPPAYYSTMTTVGSLVGHAAQLLGIIREHQTGGIRRGDIDRSEARADHPAGAWIIGLQRCVLPSVCTARQQFLVCCHLAAKDGRSKRHHVRRDIRVGPERTFSVPCLTCSPASASCPSD